MVIISEEVELLIPLLRAATPAKVHLVSYAAPVTKNMLHFDKLSYYVLPNLPSNHVFPDWLSIELGILSGRLYMEFTDYALLEKYLQLGSENSADILHDRTSSVPVFTHRPLSFLREWLSVCRKGQDILQTPMGYMCQKRTINKNHPFFTKLSVESKEPEGTCLARSEKDDEEDEEEEDRDIEFEDM